MSLEAIVSTFKFRNKGSEVLTHSNKYVSCSSITDIKEIMGLNRFVDNLSTGRLTPEDVKRFLPVFRNHCARLKNEQSKVKQQVFSILEKYEVYRNVEAKQNKDMFVFVKKETKELFEGNADAFAYSDVVCNKEGLLELKVKSPPIKFIYDPALPFGFRDNGEDIKVFNKFKVIDWDKIEDVPLPDCYPKFFEHLFPDPFQRARVYAFSSFAETCRVNFALVLFGAKGAGKSTFIELLKNLYDRDLVVLLSDGYFDNKFTGEIEHKKLAIGEEITCRGLKAKSKLKSTMNDWITIERKGENPRSGVRSHCNFIFTTNEGYSLEVEPDDRRFYIPDITKDIVSASIISEVIGTMTSLPILKAVRKYFIENRDDAFDLFYPAKDTNSFWDMCRQSANEPVDFIITELEKSKGMELTYNELREMWNRRPVKGNFQRFPHKHVIKRFFTHYCPNGKQLVTVGPYGTEYKIENEEIKIEKDPGMFS